jgi:hypothetical protein
MSRLAPVAPAVAAVFLVVLVAVLVQGKGGGVRRWWRFKEVVTICAETLYVSID